MIVSGRKWSDGTYILKAELTFADRFHPGFETPALIGMEKTRQEGEIQDLSLEGEVGDANCPFK